MRQSLPVTAEPKTKKPKRTKKPSKAGLGTPAAAPPPQAEVEAVVDATVDLLTSPEPEPPTASTPEPAAPPSAKAQRVRTALPVCPLCGLRHQSVEQYRKRAAASPLPLSEAMKAWFAKHEGKQARAS